MMSQNRSSRALALAGALVVLVGMIPGPAAAQYAVTKLVSNQTGKAKHQDTALVNAWGMSFAPGGPFWISDNGTGESTFYTGTGVKDGEITIPPISGTGAGSPTGQVYNNTTDFPVEGSPAVFIFATLDGSISGWNGGTSAVVTVKAPAGTAYTGLAIGKSNGANFLFATDFANNKVDIYNGTFKKVGSFKDPKLTGLSVYNVQNIKGKLYLTFSDNSFSKGAVDIFGTGGKLIKRLTSNVHLKAPWGVALAPKNFGPASNALLVGNVGDGRINVFNATTGKFMTQLTNTNKKVIAISGLWALAFGEGGGSNGNPNQLFFAAGTNGYADGLFGVINLK